jgi:hypothetical protein
MVKPGVIRKTSDPWYPLSVASDLKFETVFGSKSPIYLCSINRENQIL